MFTVAGLFPLKPVMVIEVVVVIHLKYKGIIVNKRKEKKKKKKRCHIKSIPDFIYQNL